ncbi:MAG: DUF5597 domain-containing protein [Phycisphaerae bacterium]|nr:DUF5597 domain-containing protein [Phycisphaerae bacterium]MDW8262858.1 DUF5597 domain-containing protein [Phycisphaerales bacterium]
MTPRLHQHECCAQLHVADSPFLILGGEIGNSTASDARYLSQAMDRCRSMAINTVLLPVYWDRIEPDPGRFDFSLVQRAIQLARDRNLRLIYLWFGTWKNGMSCYAPGWVKRDQSVFFRARTRSGAALEVISPACSAAADADAAALSALLRFTQQLDPKWETVIMVQIENEIGLMPEPLDCCRQSLAAYESAAPPEIAQALRQERLGPELQNLWQQAGAVAEGCWKDLFGVSRQGQEVFTAWQFARYVQRVASAARDVCPVPFFTNAALIRPGYSPGDYPAGGPLPHLMELWKLAAPAVNLLCPDIYFPCFEDWCRAYRRPNNPLFVPEMAASTRAPANAVLAIGQYAAIGAAPFAVEDLAFDRRQQIGATFQALWALREPILDAQRHGRIAAVTPRIDFDWNVDPNPVAAELGGVRLTARFVASSTGPEIPPAELPTLGPGRWETPPGVPLGAALIIHTAELEFLILGSGCTITFSDAGGRQTAGLESVREYELDSAGQWNPARWLNGDQTHQGRHVQFPPERWSLQRVVLYRYE